MQHLQSGIDSMLTGDIVPVQSLELLQRSAAVKAQVQQQFPFLLVDEFQDLSVTQVCARDLTMPAHSPYSVHILCIRSA